MSVRLDKDTVGFCLAGIVGKGGLYTDLQLEAQERPQHHVDTGEGRSFPRGTVADKVEHGGKWCWAGCGRDGSWSERAVRSGNFLATSPKSHFWEGQPCHQ